MASLLTTCLLLASCCVAVPVEPSWELMSRQGRAMECREDWGDGEGDKGFRWTANLTERCWRQGKVLHAIDWQCYKLHSEGPCQPGERIVYKNSTCPLTTCRPHPCPPGTAPHQGSCVDPMEPAACGLEAGQRLEPDPRGDYACRCSGVLGFQAGPEGRCWPLYRRGPCGPGHQLAPDGCRPDTCGAMDNATVARDYYRGPGDQCYSLHDLLLTHACSRVTQQEREMVQQDQRVLDSSFGGLLEATSAGADFCSDIEIGLRCAVATHCACKMVARTSGECLPDQVVQDPLQWDLQFDFIKFFREASGSSLVGGIVERILIDKENEVVIEDDYEYV